MAGSMKIRIDFTNGQCLEGLVDRDVDLGGEFLVFDPERFDQFRVYGWMVSSDDITVLEA